MNFQELGLAAPLLRALDTAGYSTPTPIQAQAIPPAMEGRDVLGCAQTGTGKTAAFALPLIHRLILAGPPPREERPVSQLQKPMSIQERRRPQRGRQQERSRPPYHPLKVLILAPTRELAVQIAESVHDYSEGTGIRLAAIYGGVGYQRQIDNLRRGIDILVATPGRLVDLMNQGHVDYSQLTAFVLDEADRMLDMGFLPDLKRIIDKLPAEKQTLFFSATMPPEIRKLADDLLHDPVTVTIAAEKLSEERIEQCVCFVPKSHKSNLLTGWIAEDAVTRAIVFTRTKHGADRVAKHLEQAGVRADAIHGNKSQNARQRTLNAFRANEVHVLVATDLAARGIDVDGISHVFNYDLPMEPETYIHRIGRTARAGAYGQAISFCDSDERGMLRGIERLLKRSIKVETNLPVVVPAPVRAEAAEPRRDHRRGPQQREGRPPRPSARPGQDRQDQRPRRPAEGASRGPRPADGQQRPQGEPVETQRKYRSRPPRPRRAGDAPAKSAR